MNLVDEKELGNGAVLAIFDESKEITGDRLMVKLRFVISLPWSGWMDELLNNEEGESEAIRQELGELTFEITKERIFVDQDEKEAVIQILTDEVNSNILSYLSQQSFVEKLFKKRLLELKDRKAARPDSAILDESHEEDDGPADFSACFK
jgi:hypothetical protein